MNEARHFLCSSLLPSYAVAPNQMQSYGSPPSEIMGPMPPGFELGEDGMPKIPDGCIIV